MFSDKDIEAWLDQFETSTKESLVHLSGLEQWTLDDDADVQQVFNQIDDLLTQTSSTDLDHADVGEVSGVSWLADVPLDDLVKLQGQLSYKRAIKLFGDMCYLDADRAQQMLTRHNVVQDADPSIAIPSHLLSRRVLLLIRLNLVHQIFSHERQQTVIRQIQSQFDE